MVVVIGGICMSHSWKQLSEQKMETSLIFALADNDEQPEI